MSGDLGNSMDLPFEADPIGMQVPDEHAHFSGGVVVIAAVIDVPDVGPKPSLVFRFAMPEGGFYPPVVLVQDDDQIAKLRPLIFQAIKAAREAAQKAAS